MLKVIIFYATDTVITCDRERELTRELRKPISKDSMSAIFNFPSKKPYFFPIISFQIEVVDVDQEMSSMLKKDGSE